MDEPGIFRLPGNPSRLEQMRGILNSGNDVDLTAFDAFSVCELLLHFFRLLPRPLFPAELNPAVCAAVRPYFVVPSQRHNSPFERLFVCLLVLFRFFMLILFWLFALV